MSLRIQRSGLIASGRVPDLEPPTSNLLDWYSPESYDSETPSWPSAGSLSRTLAKTTNSPLVGIQINGKATRDFAVGLAALKNVTGSLSQPLTFYVMVRTGLVASTQLLFDGHTGTNRITGQIISTGIVRGNAGVNLSSSAGAVREDTVYALRYTFDTVASALYSTNLDASPIAGPATTGTAVMDGLTLGAANTGSSAFPGDIAEMLIYAGAHDATAVETYLLSKYPSATKATWTAVDLMMCGDSLTVGLGSTDGRGSRSAIRLSFESNDIETGVRTLRFVGSSRDRCMSHYGVSGRPIPTLRDNIAAQLTTYTPDVVPILIGTNDCRNNGTTYDPVTTPQAYADMLSNAFTALPSAIYFAYTVPSLVNGTFDANVDDLNSKLPGLVATAVTGGMNITLLDLHAVIDTATDLDADGIHLNDSGYAKKAALEVAAIRAALA